MRVTASKFVSELKALGQLPKQYTVKIEFYSQFWRKTVRIKRNYALVQVTDGELVVTVVYDSLRKLLETLKTAEVDVAVTANELHIAYPVGKVNLIHIDGFEDLPMVELRTMAHVSE